MKNVLLLLLVCTFLNACTSSTSVSNDHKINQTSQNHYQGTEQDLHIYLLIGQSNMAGRAPILAEQYNVIENTLLFDSEGEWQLATNPLNRYSSIRKDMSMQKLGIGYAFAITMSQNLFKTSHKTQLGLVVNAKGGTSITKWQPGHKFYEEAIKRAKLAQQTGTLKGILWHQGETDFEDKDYLPKLIDLVNNLRRDLAQPNLPFVAGQIYKTPSINEQIAQLPKKVPFTEVVMAENLSAMDRWHFDNPSINKLGSGYAQAMLKLQTKLLFQSAEQN
ncbi:sialate O-acetylesterase [Paraglaciecola aquimarina]|uniref:Sialate O-acetylesterase n=1 Tax=Paraglaciecola algarum TaxID=3050085 RepID=A0ABS9D972_9ALTE|nr:sialate O-acetylesterase [Paraglaciecola sp. G1-23]MCF2949483.1 sialate O-acetylesterase [Paraglaciecola sp. G1-23]